MDDNDVVYALRHGATIWTLDAELSLSDHCVESRIWNGQCIGHEDTRPRA